MVPNRVFVGGLPFDANEEELSEFFSEFGQVRSMKVIRDVFSVSKGYGFVSFDSEEDAKQLISKGSAYYLQKRLNFGPAINQQTSNQSTNYTQKVGQTQFSRKNHKNDGFASSLLTSSSLNNGNSEPQNGNHNTKSSEKENISSSQLSNKHGRKLKTSSNSQYENYQYPVYSNNSYATTQPPCGWIYDQFGYFSPYYAPPNFYLSNGYYSGYPYAPYDDTNQFTNQIPKLTQNENSENVPKIDSTPSVMMWAPMFPQDFIQNQVSDKTNNQQTEHSH